VPLSSGDLGLLLDRERDLEPALEGGVRLLDLDLDFERDRGLEGDWDLDLLLLWLRDFDLDRDLE